MKIKLTEFSLKHFNKNNSGTKILDFTPEEFEKKINSGIGVLTDTDYADFCKYLIVDNFTSAKSGTVTLSDDLDIKTGYSARQEGELPVLSRWVEFDNYDDIPNASKLIIVLYSKNQLELEHLEKNFDSSNFEFEGIDFDYGVVAILAQNSIDADPIPPITMMRNHLGKRFGGSDVEINDEMYLKSVEFWSKNIKVK